MQRDDDRQETGGDTPEEVAMRIAARWHPGTERPRVKPNAGPQRARTEYDEFDPYGSNA